MRKSIAYRFLTIGLSTGLGWGMAAVAASAQQVVSNVPKAAEIYCSGVATNKPVPSNSYIISGEYSVYKSTFDPGDTVYFNHGADQGIKVGDEFEVIRPVSDPEPSVPWFKYQPSLSRAMGTRYADIGRLRVTHVDPKVSTAEISLGCELMQRGDIVLPFAPRPAPQFHEAKLDLYAAPSGKKTAMVVTSQNFNVLAGAGSIVYINLGSAQGVQVGDYFRIFRYQGTRAETAYQLHDTAYKTFGFGSAPVAYAWNNLPRQVMGEGIVLRTGPNSSTVLLTNARSDVYVGDYAEVE